MQGHRDSSLYYLHFLVGTSTTMSNILTLLHYPWSTWQQQMQNYFEAFVFSVGCLAFLQKVLPAHMQNYYKIWMLLGKATSPNNYCIGTSG